jgi:hypothetical protein
LNGLYYAAPFVVAKTEVVCNKKRGMKANCTTPFTCMRRAAQKNKDADFFGIINKAAAVRVGV